MPDGVRGSLLASPPVRGPGDGERFEFADASQISRMLDASHEAVV